MRTAPPDFLVAGTNPTDFPRHGSQLMWNQHRSHNLLVQISRTNNGTGSSSRNSSDGLQSCLRHTRDLLFPVLVGAILVVVGGWRAFDASITGDRSEKAVRLCIWLHGLIFPKRGLPVHAERLAARQAAARLDRRSHLGDGIHESPFHLKYHEVLAVPIPAEVGLGP